MIGRLIDVIAYGYRVVLTKFGHSELVVKRKFKELLTVRTMVFYIVDAPYTRHIRDIKTLPHISTKF